jgi:hypothetical protein
MSTMKNSRNAQSCANHRLINGGGYRDSLHWFTFLAALDEKWTEDATAVFLSNDGRAFGEDRQSILLAEVAALDDEWEVTFATSIEGFEVPGQFLDEDGYLDSFQRDSLRSAIRSALEEGQAAESLIPAVSRVDAFDNPTVRAVNSVEIEDERVQVERVSRGLWVTFKAIAVCEVSFLTIEFYDEDSGGYDEEIQRQSWRFSLTGAAGGPTAGSLIEAIHVLRIEDQEPLSDRELVASPYW